MRPYTQRREKERLATQPRRCGGARHRVQNMAHTGPSLLESAPAIPSSTSTIEAWKLQHTTSVPPPLGYPLFSQHSHTGARHLSPPACPSSSCTLMVLCVRTALGGIFSFFFPSRHCCALLCFLSLSLSLAFSGRSG